MDPRERQQLRVAFDEAVNMEPDELAAWLDSDASREVAEGEPDESIGPDVGRRVLRILRSPSRAPSDADYRLMRRVVDYVRSAQVKRPSGDVTHTRWRYALMNWGHDPSRSPGTT